MARVSSDTAFRAAYGEQEPVRLADGAISAWRGEVHWHLVTAGLPHRQLTLLVPAGEGPPPAWAFELLLGVARTEQAAGRALHAGARLAPGGPVDGAGSGLVAVALRDDPVAPDLLQVVAITAGEHALMGRVGTALVLEKLADRDLLLVTDPARATRQA